MRTLWTVFLRMCLLGLAAGCGLELTPDLEVDGAIVVGIPESDPPFTVRDDEGGLSGIYADMVRDLGLYLNREVETRALSEPDRTEAILSRSVDLIFLEAPHTDSEEQDIALSQPFAWKGLAFLTGTDSELDDVEDLNREGVVVTVIRDSRGNQFARTALPQASVRVFDGEAEAVREVMKGDADAFVGDSLQIFTRVDARTESLRAVLAPFRRVGLVVGVYPENQALLEAVNDFLFDYREIGGFDRLADRYYAEAREAFEVQGADFIFDPPERVMIEDTEAGSFSLE